MMDHQEIPLDEINDTENPFLSDHQSSNSSSKNKIEKQRRRNGLLAVGASILAFAFMLLWLAESQFSSGVLRPRYLGEECGYRLFGNLDCIKPLICNSIKRCSTSYQESKTPAINNQTITCPACPRCPTCPSCQNLVTYFDYSEYPNHWIDPGPHGFIETDFYIPYGGCKEICARNINCYGICNQGFDGSCRQFTRGHSQPMRNQSWNCAIKINFELVFLKLYKPKLIIERYILS